MLRIRGGYLNASCWCFSLGTGANHTEMADPPAFSNTTEQRTEHSRVERKSVIYVTSASLIAHPLGHFPPPTS